MMEPVPPIRAIEELKQYPQWVCFNAEKEPINPRTGGGAMANNAATWGTYDLAFRVWERNPDKYAGVGFEFVREQRITGIDLDKCIDEAGNISLYARNLIKRFNSYTEISPSGRGIHILVRGIVPKNLGPDGLIEIYDHSHYFTMTSNHLSGTPETIEDRQDVLLAVHQETVDRRRQPAPHVSPSRTPRNGNEKGAYGLAALDQEYQNVATAPQGTRNDQLNRSAYALGQLVAGGELDQGRVVAELLSAAGRAGLDESEARKTIQSGLEAGLKEPRSKPPLRVVPPAERQGSHQQETRQSDQQSQPEQPTIYDTSAIDAAIEAGDLQALLEQCDILAKISRKHYISYKSRIKEAFKGRLTMKDLDAAVDEERDGAPRIEIEDTALARIMKIAEEAHYIFTPSGSMYARVPVGAHHEVLSINEKGAGLRRWLIHEYKERFGVPPNSEAQTLAMSTIMSDCEYNGEKSRVYTRLAAKDDKVYLDLGSETWECVEISPEGWRVIECPPVYFRRPNGMLPLPIPATDGAIDDLRLLINTKEDRDFQLVVAWLLGTLHPSGPYPALNLNGERGSAKSKGTAILRNLIDPNEAPARNAPKDEREAAIAAHNNHIITLDNLSNMPNWLSDVLCRIATGSGFSARELYTNDGEIVFNSRRPIIMNGIEDGLISQGDLLQRTIMVTLTPPAEYIAEAEIDALFQDLHPGILGALLTSASVALRDREIVHLERTPRLIDFAKWVAAAEPSLGWEHGTFLTHFEANQENATSIVMETSPVAKALMQLVEKSGGSWQGLTQQLHEELSHYQIYTNAKNAPKNARALSGHLKRIAPSMRVQKLDIVQLARTTAGVPVRISRISDVANHVAN